MPHIKTQNGTIKYKVKPLYLGKKRIDKVQALENLILLKKIFDIHDFKFVMIYGTLLGAIRENDFIDHDEDIDLAIKYEDKTKLLSLLPDLIENKFEIARWYDGEILSIIRNGEYIDIYLFKDFNGKLLLNGGLPIPREFLEDTCLFNFKGYMFNVPSKYIDALEFIYGSNWETPIQYTDFKLTYWQRKKKTIKEKIRYMLPTWLVRKITRRNEIKQFEGYRKRGVLDNYL